MPQRLEEKKKAQAEKDHAASATVSLPIPDSAAKDADGDVSPEVENQPDTGQAVICGDFVDPQKGPFEL